MTKRNPDGSNVTRVHRSPAWIAAREARSERRHQSRIATSAMLDAALRAAERRKAEEQVLSDLGVAPENYLNTDADDMQPWEKQLLGLDNPA